MSRYPIAVLFGLAGMISVAVAHEPDRVPVIGLLLTHPPVNDPVVEALRIGLRQFGYEDGRNIKLEVRTAQGQLSRVPSIASELVGLRVDAIVAGNEVALRASMKSTSTIPIVMIGFNDDPVALGWINSYGHPGGNVTGTYNVNAALIAKRLAIDASDIRRENATTRKGLCHAVEHQGKLRRDLFVRADVPVQSLVGPRCDLRLLSGHPGVQHPGR